MKVLVTGDSGYIGSVLVSLLLAKKYFVVGYDADFYKKVADRESVIFGNSYKRIIKDIRKINTSDLKDIDAIIHLSALSNDPIGALDPKLTAEINFKASIRLAKLAKKTGVKRFIFSSSCSIYGVAKNGIVNERSGVNPITMYAKSKINTEEALKRLSDKNFFVGILRNSTVYGYSPCFRNDLVVNNLVTTALAYKEIRIMSDGTPWRPLIDVRDLSNIFIKFLETEDKEVNGNIINIGFNENNFQVKDLVNEVKKNVRGCKIVYTGEHGKDTRSYKVNFDKLKSFFPDVKQEWSLSKSIKDLVLNLNKISFSKKDFESKKYERLSVIKSLMKEKKLTKDLFINN